MENPAPSEFELVVFVGEERQSFPLPAGANLSVGRGDGCSIRIEHASVSRRHAELRVGPPFYVEDLGGPNGTQVVDRSAPRSVDQTEQLKLVSGAVARVEVGDPIAFGRVTALIRRREVPRASDLDVSLTDPALIRDPETRALYAQAARAAASQLGILILGETGVGKELLARGIHEASRRPGPFVAINCAALGETLVESELFGHERGAFTGAAQAKPGLLESAEQGTVFFDEVGELPAALQAKLLRVLEDGAVLRVGARTPRPLNVRFIAATNRSLELEVQAGRFRRDLYFRLNGVAFTLPPLRERPLDIAPLARFFVERLATELERSVVPELTPAVVAALEAHVWPGNVRELRHAVERALVLSSGSRIELEHLPRAVLERADFGDGKPATPRPSEKPTAEKLLGDLRSLERERVVEALEASGGNQTQAAARLGVARRTLIARMEEFGLPRPRKRE